MHRRRPRAVLSPAPVAAPDGSLDGMRSLLLLANPAASGLTGGMHREVVQVLASSYEVRTSWPESGEETRSRAAEAAAAGTDLVAAFGGDGVVHHAANGLANTGTVLGIIPAGTTNVLARILGIPPDPRAAASLLCGEHAITALPLISALVEGAGGRSAFLATFAAGVGYDAEVVRRAELEPFRKYRLGWLHYARSAVIVLWSEYRHRLPNLRISDGTRRADAVAALAQVHWPYTYFGSLPLSITDRPPHGLAVLAMETLPARRIPGLLAMIILRKRLDRLRGLQVWDGVARVTIEADPPAPVQADGEPLGEATHIELRAAPGALRIAVPTRRPGRGAAVQRLAARFRARRGHSSSGATRRPAASLLASAGSSTPTSVTTAVTNSSATTSESSSRPHRPEARSKRAAGSALSVAATM